MCPARGEAPLAQIAKDFGLSVTTMKRWITIAERAHSDLRLRVNKSQGSHHIRNQVRLPSAMVPTSFVRRGEVGLVADFRWLCLEISPFAKGGLRGILEGESRIQGPRCWHGSLQAACESQGLHNEIQRPWCVSRGQFLGGRACRTDFQA